MVRQLNMRILAVLFLAAIVAMWALLVVTLVRAGWVALALLLFHVLVGTLERELVRRKVRTVQDMAREFRRC